MKKYRFKMLVVVNFGRKGFYLKVTPYPIGCSKHHHLSIFMLIYNRNTLIFENISILPRMSDSLELCSIVNININSELKDGILFM